MSHLGSRTLVIIFVVTKNQHFVQFVSLVWSVMDWPFRCSKKDTRRLREPSFIIYGMRKTIHVSRLVAIETVGMIQLSRDTNVTNSDDALA